MMSGDSPDSAQLLLLGHRRLKREATVRQGRAGGAGWRGVGSGGVSGRQGSRAGAGAVTTQTDTPHIGTHHCSSNHLALSVSPAPLHPPQIGEDPLRVTALHLKNESYVNDDIVKATSMELVNTMKDLLNMNPLYGEQFKTLMSLTGGLGFWVPCRGSEGQGFEVRGTEGQPRTTAEQFKICTSKNNARCCMCVCVHPSGSIDLGDLSRLVDAAASLTSADDVTLQDILETLDVPERWVVECSVLFSGSGCFGGG